MNGEVLLDGRDPGVSNLIALIDSAIALIDSALQSWTVTACLIMRTLRMSIIWLNGTHGAGKTTTSRLLQPLLPDSQILDAEKVGEVLTDIAPGLPETDNFQHWPPWRSLVVETARRVHQLTGGPLIMPMTVLVEAYWREISTGLASYEIPVRHFLIHVDRSVLIDRIQSDSVVGPSTFRSQYIEAYGEALRDWLRRDAEIIDTTSISARDAAEQIVRAVGAPP